MSQQLPDVAVLSNRVIRILGFNANAFTLQGTNSYLIGTGQRRILVDTTDANLPKYHQCLTTVLEEHGVQIDRIILTHYHADHVDAVKEVIHQLSYAPPVHKIEHTSDDVDVGYAYLKDGDEFSVEGATLRVIATPGHTPDHLCLLLVEENALFSGDCILGEGPTIFDDFGLYLKSLKKVEDLRPSLIYPGHGPVVQDSSSRIQSYRRYVLTREKQIYDCVAAAKGTYLTALEVVHRTFLDDLEDKSKLKMVEHNVKGHLRKLMEENRLVSRERDDGFYLELEYAARTG